MRIKWRPKGNSNLTNPDASYQMAGELSCCSATPHCHIPASSTEVTFSLANCGQAEGTKLSPHLMI